MIVDVRVDMPEEPITEDWLKAHGFRSIDHRNDDRLPVWRLDVGRRTSDDLCIDLSLARDGGWFCWLHQPESYRFMRVRHMRETWEVIRLFEGLTGREWGEGSR